MVVANRQGRYKYSSKGEAMKQENLVPNQKPNKIKQSFFGRAVAMTCVVAVIGVLVIFYIHQFVQISTTNYEINRLKREIAAMEAENDAIRLEIVQSKNLKRVEQVARTQLDMVSPGPKETCYISVPKESSVTTVTTESTGSGTSVFVRDMMAWLKNLTSVEAGTLDE